MLTDASIQNASIPDLPQRYTRPPSPPPTYEEAAKVAAASRPATIEGKITGEKSAVNESANPGSEKLGLSRYEADESPPEYASAIAASAMQDLAVLRSKILEASEVDHEVEVALRQGDGNADEFGLLLGDLNDEDEENSDPSCQVKNKICRRSLFGAHFSSKM